MNKNNIFLFIIFSFLLIITLTSCSDAYSGNYVEVKDKEELANVTEKINNVSIENEKNSINYETIITTSVRVSLSTLSSIEGKLSSRSITDINKKIVYTKNNMKIVNSGGNGSLLITTETWLNYNQNEYSFINYSYNENMLGEKTNKSGKYKAFVKDIDSLYDIAVLDDYTSMFNLFDEELDINVALEALEKGEAKIYVDGNKIKIECNFEGMKAIVYLILNEDNTYQMKFVLPNVSIGDDSMNYVIDLEAEIKPTSTNIKLPNEEEYTNINKN